MGEIFNWKLTFVNPHPDPLIFVKLILGKVSSSRADYMSTRVAWMFTWWMEMSVKPLRLSKYVKFAPQDWPSWISKTRNDLNI